MVEFATGVRPANESGDEARGGGGPDERPLGRKARDIFIPDLRIETGIKIKTRDFR